MLLINITSPFITYPLCPQVGPILIARREGVGRARTGGRGGGSCGATCPPGDARAPLRPGLTRRFIARTGRPIPVP